MEEGGEEWRREGGKKDWRDRIELTLSLPSLFILIHPSFSPRFLYPIPSVGENKRGRRREIEGGGRKKEVGN